MTDTYHVPQRTLGKVTPRITDPDTPSDPGVTCGGGRMWSHDAHHRHVQPPSERALQRCPSDDVHRTPGVLCPTPRASWITMGGGARRLPCRSSSARNPWYTGCRRCGSRHTAVPGHQGHGGHPHATTSAPHPHPIVPTIEGDHGVLRAVLFQTGSSGRRHLDSGSLRRDALVSEQSGPPRGVWRQHHDARPVPATGDWGCPFGSGVHMVGCAIR